MTERGNPDNLRAAAQRKHDDAVDCAQQPLRALVRGGEPVNFRAVARLADCSPDFLYLGLDALAGGVDSGDRHD